jgi:deazaflavin-dependent oxidoreductase (nitroreductase family)
VLTTDAGEMWFVGTREDIMREQNEEILDSPTDWVAKHINNYVESGGAKGHKWSGDNTLLLTTRGRKSGKLRRTALIYGQDGDRYVVVASNGGAANDPLWYLNLLQEPRVEVQVGSEVFKARARPATEEEKPLLWQMMAKIFPLYDQYQKKTTREIPVAVLERLDEPGSTS